MWPQKVKTMQSNWIGRSEGAEISFSITGNNISEQNYIKVYTTRPDTIFGATFLAISPEHELSKKIFEEDIDAKKFSDAIKKIDSDKTKVGYKTNIFVQHPFLEKKFQFS